MYHDNLALLYPVLRSLLPNSKPENPTGIDESFQESGSFKSSLFWLASKSSMYTLADLS